VGYLEAEAVEEGNFAAFVAGLDDPEAVDGGEAAADEWGGGLGA
jgi:hypothetical protein